MGRKSEQQFTVTLTVKVTFAEWATYKQVQEDLRGIKSVMGSVPSGTLTVVSSEVTDVQLEKHLKY